MKAVRIHRYGGPEVLVYEEVDTPQPGPGQVLVRVRATGVNPIDVAIRADRFPTPRRPPKTIGSDGAGVVTAVGPEVTTVAIGDQVMFTGLGIGSEGSYADYAVIAEAQAVAKPASLSFEQAAAMGPSFPPRTTLWSAGPPCSRVRPSSSREPRAGSAAPRCRSPAPSALECWRPSPWKKSTGRRGAWRRTCHVRHAADVGAEIKGITDGRAPT